MDRADTGADTGAEPLGRRARVASAVTARPWWLGLVAGLLMALGTPPFDLWPLALAGLVACFALFRRASSPRAAALVGWCAGLGYFGLSMIWLVEPFMVDVAATGWMAPFGLFGMAGGLSLFWALAFWLSRRFGAGHDTSAATPAAMLVVLWAGAELARAYVLTGFPWALLSYLWLESPAIQWVAVIGPHGLVLVTLALACLAERALARATWSRAAIPSLGLAILLGGGLLLMPPRQDLSDRPVVRLVQPNAPQDQKWRRDMIPVFYNRTLDLTAAPPQGARAPDLVIWPETTLPMLLDQADLAFEHIRDAAPNTPVMLGIQRVEDGRYYNSLAALNAQGDLAQVYDKHHLVPFGEYMPLPGFWANLGITGLAARAEAGYAAGPGPALVDLGPLGRVLPLICYEAVFPQDVGAALARPDWLVNITNDAWFGTWSGPQQHLAQARVRAIEQGLPMLRAANTGVSAVIDGGGRLIATIALNTTGFVDAPLPRPLRATVYARTGDWPAGGALLLLVIGMLCLKRGTRT